jgi:probable phosphoglycerate mutase
MDELWLVRHGATEWSISRQHTGRTDLELLPEGVHEAKLLGEALRGRRFGAVFSSPLRRARDTAALAGFPEPHIDEDLLEWDYGDYEGLTGDQILADRPDWDLWIDGCPGGESPDQVFARCERFLATASRFPGAVLVFGHGHLSRALAGCFLKLERVSALGKIEAASLCVLGWEKDLAAVKRWNLDCHLDPGAGAGT